VKFNLFEIEFTRI